MKLSIIIACCFLLFAGCSARENDNKTPEVTVKTMPVPEDGWTAEKLAESIEINGKKFDVGFTVKSMGENYHLDFGDGTIKNKTSQTAVLYNGELPVAIVGYRFEHRPNDFTSEQPYFISALPEYSSANVFSINGLSPGATREAAQAVLGTPDKTNELAYFYRDVSTERIIAVLNFGNDGKLTGCVFYLNGSTEE